MRPQVRRETVPAIIAFVAAAAVVCVLPGDLGVLARIGILSAAAAVWLVKIWPWD